MTAALWLCAVWWGLMHRVGPTGFEMWKPVEQSDPPSWEHFVVKWTLS